MRVIRLKLTIKFDNVPEQLLKRQCFCLFDILFDTNARASDIIRTVRAH
jgi:hypothetical protein